jgi:hypothetical protein
MLVFIDESGYPRPTDENEYSVLMAVCVYEKDIKAIDNDIYKLKNLIYEKQDEIKATNIIKRQTIEKNRTKNKEYAESFVSTAAKYNITTFCIIMKRPTEAPIVEDGILPKQYHLLMKKVEYFCERRNIEKSIFVFDETNEKEDLKTANSFSGFLFKSRLGKTFSRILEMPLFVSSKITPAIQIADIFAGIVRQYYSCGLNNCAPSTEYEIWLKSLYDKIIDKTEDSIQPNRKYFEYGFQYIENLNYVKQNKIP